MLEEQRFDRIEREITIAAPRSHVWELVSEPGWWINDGAITAHEIEPDGPDRVIVHDPGHGRFVVAIVDQRPQEYAAFRWYSGPSAARRLGELVEDASTLVEFFVSSEGSDMTRLRVVESGFAHLDEEAQRRRMMFEENTAGWSIELLAISRHVEGVRP